MKRFLILLFSLSHTFATAQSAGDWLIPVKTAGGRTEKTVTLSNGEVLGKTGGNPAAVSLGSYLTSATAASTYQPLDSDLTSYASSPNAALATVLDAATADTAVGAFKFPAIGTSGPTTGALRTITSAALVNYFDGYYLKPSGGATAGTLPLASFTITGTLPVANGGTGVTSLGIGVATALGNAVNATGGPLTYAIIGTSGAAVPLLNGTNTFSGVATFTAAPIISTGSDVGTNLTIRNAAGTQPRVQMGTLATSTTYGAIYLGNVTPSGTNYAFVGDGASTYINGPTTLRVAVGGTEQFNVTSFQLGLNSSTHINWNTDVYLIRDAAATLQMGVDSATPITQRIAAPDGSGTNIAGGSIGLQSGLSTGTGAGGDVFVETSMSGSSGSSANSAQERARIIGRYKDLTEATATNLASIALASGKVLGGTATITVWAADASDCQAITSEVRFSAVNKAGTITATVTQTDNTTAASAGTLNVTYDATQSGSAVLLRANATSSLTQTTLRARLVLTALNGDDVQTVTPQ